MSSKAHAGVIPLLLLAVVACGGGPVLPGEIVETLSDRLDTQSVSFHFTPGDAVDANWQQGFHDWITGQLEVQLPAKLQYYKYTDRGQMSRITGRNTNGFAEPSVYAVHSIFPHDGHEAVHVYSALVGRPSNFFNEGIAVALNIEPDAAVGEPQWNGTHVYAHTQLLVRTNQFRPLSGIVSTDGFRGVSEWVGYGEAGSFVLFLVEQYGIDRMLVFFRMSAQGDSLSRIEANVQSVWRMSLSEAEAAWLEYVGGWSG